MTTTIEWAVIIGPSVHYARAKSALEAVLCVLNALGLRYLDTQFTVRPAQ
jgi:hypothetical protein